MIHPTDLRRRRERCRPVVERFDAAPRATAADCNACGGRRRAILATRDRYGLAVRTAVCLECGLVYLLEPLTAEVYADFYASGSYRDVTGRFSGKRRTLPQIRAGQIDYAERVFHTVEAFLPEAAGSARLLDVGASTGLVAERFRRRLGYGAWLLDPAVREIRQPETAGMQLVESTFEEWHAEGRFELILLCRTVEHLLDLRGSLAKIRELLTPDGVFFCDVADFFEICRLEGPAEAVSRIDHCFWLTQETARVFFRRLGFEPVAIDCAAPFDQVGFVLRRAEPDPAAGLPPGWIDRELRRLREIGSDWRTRGQRALDPEDWLRRRAYRLKRRLAGGG